MEGMGLVVLIGVGVFFLLGEMMTVYFIADAILFVISVKGSLCFLLVNVVKSDCNQIVINMSLGRY